MNLTELCSYICTKVGQPDAASMAACQTFVNARWQQIWDAAAWRESLALVPVTAGAGTAIIPPGLERVLAVRLNAAGGVTLNQNLPPFELNVLFQFEAALWDEAGQPSMFATLSPTVIPCAPPGGGARLLAWTDPGAESALDPDLGAACYFAGDDDAGGPRFEETAPLGAVSLAGGSFGAAAAAAHAYGNATAFSKPATANTVYLSYGTSAYGSGADVRLPAATLSPSQTNAAMLERIRLLSPGAGAVGLLVLGKRRFAPMRDPQSQPALRNCDNLLIALATGDMLERQRQYAKAQLKFQEAREQLNLLLDLERNQSAGDLRIIPAQIHGALESAGAFGLNGKGFW